MGDEVVGNALDSRDGCAVELARGVDDEDILEIFPQFFLQHVLFGQRTHQVEFVAPLVESEQFPHGEQERHGIGGTLHGQSF